jgi:uncharacterized membrane protein
MDFTCSARIDLVGFAANGSPEREFLRISLWEALMPHCTKCGAVVAEAAGFCGSCGAAQGPATGAPAASVPVAAASQPGLAENVAGALSYALGWITGLIFFLIDKRPYVRFHAAQSIVVFGGLNILSFVLGVLFGISLITGGWTGFSLGWALHRLIELVALILWILLMIKAYQGQRFRVPFAADIAEKMFGKA